MDSLRESSVFSILFLSVAVLFVACTPSSGHNIVLKTYSGEDCIGECKTTTDPTYSWCFVRKNGRTSWDHCPRNQDNSTEFYTSQKLTAYGLPCLTECKKTGNTTYNWCETTKYPRIYGSGHNYIWDYCSVSSGEDYFERKCLDECSYRGYNYKWCRVHGGSWGYCS